MKAHQAGHGISIMARVLGLSKSGYYAWLGRELKQLIAWYIRHGEPWLQTRVRAWAPRVGASQSSLTVGEYGL